MHVNFYFDGNLNHEDFSILKRDCEEKIKRLEATLSEAKVQKSNTMSIYMFQKPLNALSNLKLLYEEGDA